MGQHRLGIDVFMRGVCDRLAGAGIVAAAPDIYHRHWDKAQFDEITALPRADDQEEGAGDEVEPAGDEVEPAGDEVEPAGEGGEG